MITGCKIEKNSTIFLYKENMENYTKVAVIRCGSYDIQEVRDAIHTGFDLLGGMGQFAKPGEKILIKPNLLVGEAPDNAISPHPAVFQALIEQLQRTGAKILFGDSPAVGSMKSAAKRAGLIPVAENLGVEMADMQTPLTIGFPEGNLIKQFTIAKGVIESDGLISLCKMKSHALTRITGAVKNQFGCVPGLLKTEFHTTLPNVTAFSKMLVDINLYLKPRLYIMDGIIAMEGNGPRNGTRKPMNVLLLSNDPIALDTAFCRLINLDENLVETIVYGNQFGLGSSQIEIVGDSIDSLRVTDFNVNREKAIASDWQGAGFSKFIRKYVSPRPVINSESCTQCGKCEEVCPAQPKALSWKNGKKSPPVYSYEKCIRCFCCQEMCPHRAISVTTPFLGRMIQR